MSYTIVYFAFFLALIMLISGLYLYNYVAANRAYREYKTLSPVLKKKFLDSRRKLTWIKKHTELNWPIWPRPLVFNEIDHSTQLALGSAENAYEILEDLNRTIRPINPLPSTYGAILKIFENRQRLIAKVHNEKCLNEFDWYCQTIEQAYITIRKNLKEIDTIKREIRKKVDNTARDFTASNNNIQFFQKLGSIRYNDAIRNIEIAQDCINRADFELASASEDDLVEWVAADTLCFAGLISLSIFKLKSRSYTFPETFEADLALTELSKLSSSLEAILDFKNFHNWRYLILLRTKMVASETVTAEVDKSLDVFKMEVQRFNDLLNRLVNFNIDEILDHSYKVQQELEEYIGTTTNSDEWEAVLFRHQLPSIRLEEMKFQFTQNIETAYQGAIIKQSQLPEINDSINDFLKGIEICQAVIKRIDWTVQYYIACEQEVKQLLSRSGKVERLVIRIREFSDDTANDIKQKCKKIMKGFKDLEDTAFGDRKRTRFPVLLERTKAFVDECEGVIKQHNDAIEDLQIEAINLYRRVDELQTSLNEYQNKQPIIKFNWSSVMLDFTQVMQMYDERGSSYSAITTFIKNARVCIYDKKSLRRKFAQQHEAYNRKVGGINRSIETAQNQNASCIEELKKNWSRPLGEDIGDLKYYQEEFKQLAGQLQNIQNDLQMKEAMNFCEVMNQRIQEVIEQQKHTIDQALYLKQDLDQLKKHFDKLQANKRLTENNAFVVAEANKLFYKAWNEDSHDKAKIYLQEAKDLLEHAHLAVPSTNINIGELNNYGQANIAREIHNISREASRINRKGGQR